MARSISAFAWLDIASNTPTIRLDAVQPILVPRRVRDWAIHHALLVPMLWLSQPDRHHSVHENARGRDLANTSVNDAIKHANGWHRLMPRSHISAPKAYS